MQVAFNRYSLDCVQITSGTIKRLAWNWELAKRNDLTLCIHENVRRKSVKILLGPLKNGKTRGTNFNWSSLWLICPVPGWLIRLFAIKEDLSCRYPRMVRFCQQHFGNGKYTGTLLIHSRSIIGPFLSSATIVGSWHHRIAVIPSRTSWQLSPNAWARNPRNYCAFSWGYWFR